MKLKQSLAVEKMPTVEEVALHISDLASGKLGVFNYAAVIVLDLTTIRGGVFIVSVHGDNLEHAIEEFMQRDESLGLYKEYFDDSIATIVYQASY
tara:strand:+ start:3676 stop:3960 length:285 start_codon:yes stop_codon:yes gene_type:complete